MACLYYRRLGLLFKIVKVLPCDLLICFVLDLLSFFWWDGSTVNAVFIYFSIFSIVIL